MEFYYNSSQLPIRKVLSEEIVRDVRAYIMKAVEGKDVDDMTYGEIMDTFLSYRRPNGNRLLLNQLEPLYTYFCLFRGFPAENEEDEQ